jgi:hypothetical protein
MIKRPEFIAGLGSARPSLEEEGGRYEIPNPNCNIGAGRFYELE